MEILHHRAAVRVKWVGMWKQGNAKKKDSTSSEE
jgi:hypothetical protein